MHWELWETGGKNLVEEFDSEAEGLQAVREMLAVNKPDLLDSLVLVAMYDEGESKDVELPPALRGEALQARLTEMAQQEVAEAAHKMHARIRKWLVEDGWGVQDIDNDQALLDVFIDHPDGKIAEIIQPDGYRDRVTILSRWQYGDDTRQMLSQIHDIRSVVFGIYRDVLLMGLQFDGLDAPSTEMSFSTYVYFDGLSKDALFQKVLLVGRASDLAMQTMIHALEAQGYFGSQVRPRDEIVKIMRTAPVAGSVSARAS